uniref:Secreted protein n=1 Tax=Anopheles darlingi TaxID=43151 RepID=A0A2M4DKI2_ANODA
MHVLFVLALVCLFVSFVTLAACPFPPPPLGYPGSRIRSGHRHHPSITFRPSRTTNKHTRITPSYHVMLGTYSLSLTHSLAFCSVFFVMLSMSPPPTSTHD